MTNDSYRMNRNEVKSMTFQESDNHVSYWEDKTPEERLNAACFLINQIFGVTQHTKVDKKIIDFRKHE
jgi:hypothetical protein